MKIKDLLERSGVQSLSGGCREEEITALTYDSRKAQTGSLFFCLRAPVPTERTLRRRPMHRAAAVSSARGRWTCRRMRTWCGYRMPVRRWRRSRRRFSAFPSGM